MTRRKVAPAKASHWVAACGHWCFCYSPTVHAEHRVIPDGPVYGAQRCQECERVERSRRAVAQADPISRHPEGA